MIRKNCLNCGRNFFAVQSRTKYCGVKCFGLAQSRRKYKNLFGVRTTDRRTRVHRAYRHTAYEFTKLGLGPLSKQPQGLRNMVFAVKLAKLKLKRSANV